MGIKINPKTFTFDTLDRAALVHALREDAKTKRFQLVNARRESRIAMLEKALARVEDLITTLEDK